MQDLVAGVLFFIYACLELEFELVFSGYRHAYVVVQGFFGNWFCNCAVLSRM